MNIRAIRASDLMEYIYDAWGPNEFIAIRLSSGGSCYEGNFEIDKEFVENLFAEYDEEDQAEASI